MFFSTLSFYDNFAENVVIFVVMSLAFFQPKYLKCGTAQKFSTKILNKADIRIYQNFIINSAKNKRRKV